MRETEFQRLLESSWQRPLTPPEQARLESWLSRRPQDQAIWEEETALNQLLGQLPDVPVASNFTARVGQALDKAPAAKPVSHGHGFAWAARLRQWRPRLIGSALALILGWVAVQFYLGEQRKALLYEIKALANLTVLPHPEDLKDFEPIHQLSTVPPATLVDEELYAVLRQN